MAYLGFNPKKFKNQSLVDFFNPDDINRYFLNVGGQTDIDHNVLIYFKNNKLESLLVSER